MRLFEYGSGYSTLFYARRVQTVTAVEGDKKWLNKLKNQLPENADVFFCPEDIDGKYCRSIRDKSVPFDVVVVDGRDRIHCLQQCLDRLSSRGVVVLDDAQRPEYRTGIDWMTDRGFKHLSLEGLRPNGFEADRVSFFYRDGNCFGL